MSPSAGEDAENRSLILCFKMVQAFWKRVGKFLKHSACGPAVALLGIYAREMKKYVPTETYTQMFIIAQTRKRNPNALQCLSG